MQRRPPPVVGARRVRDDDVRVEQRVAGARRAMTERGADEPVPLHDDRAALAAARPACLALHVRHRLRDRGIVSDDDLARHRRIGDAEEDTHALRGAERQIKAGDGPLGQGSSEQLAGRRVASLEQPDDSFRADFARQAERRSAAAHPHAGCFALARVVVLAALRDPIDVIAAGARPRSVLADVQHPGRPSRRDARAGKPMRVGGERSNPAGPMKYMRGRRTCRPQRLKRRAATAPVPHPSGGASLCSSSGFAVVDYEPCLATLQDDG
jgi:hypothetical protein